MVINRYENSQIKFESLPISWQSQNVLDELADFFATKLGTKVCVL